MLFSSASKGLDPNIIGATSQHEFFSHMSLQQLRCVNRSIEAAVSPGTRIFIPMGDPYWRQRIIEMQYGRLLPVLQIEKAEVLLSITKVDESEGCMGVKLVSVRLP